jgi:hypothetical protein
MLWSITISSPLGNPIARVRIALLLDDI